MPVRTILSKAPILLGPTLAPQSAGRGDPTCRIAPAEAWVAMRLASGAATLHLRGEGLEIEAEAWGEGAAEALERAPGVIGAGDNPSGFEPDHPILRDLARRHTGIRITRSAAVTTMLIKSAVGQVVTGKEAKASYRRLALAIGEPAPGPGDLVVPPDPQVLAAMAYHRYHPFAIERKRAETIIRIARHAGRIDEAAELPLAEAYRRMRAVPGVGPWTAALTGLTALGDADAVPVGDYNLPHTVAWLLEGEPRSTDQTEADSATKPMKSTSSTDPCHLSNLRPDITNQPATTTTTSM